MGFVLGSFWGHFCLIWGGHFGVILGSHDTPCPEILRETRIPKLSPRSSLDSVSSCVRCLQQLHIHHSNVIRTKTNEANVQITNFLILVAALAQRHAIQSAPWTQHCTTLMNPHQVMQYSRRHALNTAPQAPSAPTVRSLQHCTTRTKITSGDVIQSAPCTQHCTTNTISNHGASVRGTLAVDSSLTAK